MLDVLFLYCIPLVLALLQKESLAAEGNSAAVIHSLECRNLSTGLEQVP